MELRNRTTGAVIADWQFRAEHPNVSFPRVLTAQILDSFGYDPVLEGAPATITPPYEYSYRSGVEQVNGQWFTRYLVGPVFTDNEQQTAAEQEAAYRQGVDAAAADRVRLQRDQLLRDSDWVVVQEQELAAREPRSASFNKPINNYRQALRDITKQPGFPHSVTWPDKP